MCKFFHWIDVEEIRYGLQHYALGIFIRRLLIRGQQDDL